MLEGDAVNKNLWVTIIPKPTRILPGNAKIVRDSRLRANAPKDPDAFHNLPPKGLAKITLTGAKQRVLREFDLIADMLHQLSNDNQAMWAQQQVNDYLLACENETARL
jgi:hypothetical protein